ncbi:hypothetical protein GIB67_038527 [Kingdonia uniflora]|uniref:Uncharacterized protein n=1 Tax=Kingdonia uniflora TaxID=39325 RepID=A0A7J7NPQ6_9MAGN|nr:hypothetical protein GIB67_038527 [Kingdonia uniflora]
MYGGFNLLMLQVFSCPILQYSGGDSNSPQSSPSVGMNIYGEYFQVHKYSIHEKTEYPYGTSRKRKHTKFSKDLTKILEVMVCF